jgi:hypothetical protein
MGGVYSPRPMAGRRTRRKRHRGSVEELPRGTSACGYSPPSTRSAVASTTSARSRHAGILLYPFPATASLAPVLTASSRPAPARRGSPLRSRPAPLPPVPLGVQVPPASRADCINRRGVVPYLRRHRYRSPSLPATLYGAQSEGRPTGKRQAVATLGDAQASGWSPRARSPSSSYTESRGLPLWR